MVHEQENTKPEGVYISSIAGLVRALETLGVPAQGTSRFFRGHGNFNYQLQPSIYRNQHLVANEDKIIRDAFTYCPESFSENETLFEKLVKLQHYGYATRLLDLTDNALVALYFAVSSSQDKAAELLVLDIPETEIKYSDSDTAAVLSAIALQPNLDLQTYKRESQERALLTALSALSKIQDTLSQERAPLTTLGALSKIQDTLSINKMIEKIKNRNSEIGEFFLELQRNYKANLWSYEDSYKDEFNKIKEIVSLTHIVRNDKPSFRPVIEPDDLERILCVRAKLNNPRITRQQGLFLLFGIGDDKSEQAQVDPSWIKSSAQRILIKSEHKEKILKELRTFGITKQYLFPELDSQAQEIMNRYKPE